MSRDQLVEFTKSLGLIPPPDYVDCLNNVEALGARVASIVCRPIPPAPGTLPLGRALSILGTARIRPPSTILPIAPVDQRSFACVVCQRDGRPPSEHFAKVVRWHLDDVPARSQGELLDVTVRDYLTTLERTANAHDEGVKILRNAAKSYESHLRRGKGLGRSFVTRPIRLAVQNVIVGMAAYHYDSKHDALVVDAWQSCQASHVAAHEGTRGLLAYTLAEAFRSGSTMEIRFGRHPEHGIPAVIRQYARVRGIDGIASDDGRALTPEGARTLMWAVTSVPTSLRSSLEAACDAGDMSPERGCYSVLSGTWSPVSMDFMLAASPGVAKRVLLGGSGLTEWHGVRQEMALARASFLAEWLIARSAADSRQTRAADSTTVYEDAPVSRRWTVLSDIAGLELGASMPCPWGSINPPNAALVFLPRDFLDINEAEILLKQLAPARQAVFLLPHDVPIPERLMPSVQVFRAPWTLDAIDREVRRRMLTMRLARQ